MISIKDEQTYLKTITETFYSAARQLGGQGILRRSGKQLHAVIKQLNSPQAEKMTWFSNPDLQSAVVTMRDTCRDFHAALNHSPALSDGACLRDNPNIKAAIVGLADIVKRLHPVDKNTVRASYDDACPGMVIFTCADPYSPTPLGIAHVEISPPAAVITSYYESGALLEPIADSFLAITREAIARRHYTIRSFGAQVPLPCVVVSWADDVGNRPNGQMQQLHKAYLPS